MSNNNAKAFKSGAWYIAANFLIRASALITTPIFTRLLSQQEYGLYNNFTSWESILAILCTFNVQASLISARYDYEEKLDEYILSALGLSVASIFIWTFILNLISEWTQSFLSLNMAYINLMMASILFLKVIEMFQVKERYFFRYKSQVGLSLLSTFASAGLSLLLVTFMNDRLTGRILGSVLPTIIIGLGLFIYFFSKGKHIRIRYWKYALMICLPYIPHLLSMTILGSTDRIMITKLCGSADTALYSLAYNCGMIISILLTSINTAFSPWLAERLHENDIQSVRNFSKYYISGFVFIAFGFMLLAPEILLILGGNRYLPALWVIPPVGMGCICQFLYTMMVNVEQIKRKTIGMALASVAAALTNYVLNLLLIPKFGYIAAGYTTLVGYLLLLVLHMWMVYRMGMSNVYNFKFVMGTAVVSIIVMLEMNAVYSIPIARYALLVAYVLITMMILYKNRQQLCLFIKTFQSARTVE